MTSGDISWSRLNTPMFISLATVVELLMTYRYFVLFPLSVLEGPIVTILAGFLSSLGYLDIWLVYALVVLGDLVGDSLFYAIGFWGREQVISRWGHHFGITMDKIKKLEEHWTQYGGTSLVIGKISHAIGAVFLIAAGMARMPFGSFLWFNFVATIPKSLVLILIGYYFGHAYVQLSKYLHYSVLVAGILIGLLLSLYFILFRLTRFLRKQAPL